CPLLAQSRHRRLHRTCLQVSGDLGFNVLSPELLGDAVEAFGKYAKPPAHQNHISIGRKGCLAQQ
ncbi:MAG TPA: hypothetical protein VGD41_04245, partial [Pyrinomonadaceae bacterium]